MNTENFSFDQQAVMNAILEMTASFHKQDINGVMSSYESNAVIVFEPEKPVSDRDAIREGFFSFFAVNPKFEYSNHEVFINGDLAMHFAPWTMTGNAPDGTEIKQSGLSVAVLRRQIDGKWLMVFDNPFGQHLLDLRSR
jgi:ketosteroid isomerase-like protein